MITLSSNVRCYGDLRPRQVRRAKTLNYYFFAVIADEVVAVKFNCVHFVYTLFAYSEHVVETISSHSISRRCSFKVSFRKQKTWKNLILANVGVSGISLVSHFFNVAETEIYAAK